MFVQLRTRASPLTTTVLEIRQYSKLADTQKPINCCLQLDMCESHGDDSAFHVSGSFEVSRRADIQAQNPCHSHVPKLARLTCCGLRGRLRNFRLLRHNRRRLRRLRAGSRRGIAYVQLLLAWQPTGPATTPGNLTRQWLLIFRHTPQREIRGEFSKAKLKEKIGKV